MRRDDDILTIGMGFGDEAKGSFISYIANVCDADYYVKYNGGCQGRHCVLYDNKKYVFSQLSPSILKGHHTILSDNFVFEPFSLLNEIDAISNTSKIDKEELLKRLLIDEKSICVTIIHKLFNQIEESSLENLSRGSVGTGVSISGFYSEPRYEDITLRAADLLYEDRIEKILGNQKNFFVALCLDNGYNTNSINDVEIEEYAKELYNSVEHNLLKNIVSTKSIIEKNKSVYESSQGILLDRKYGFYPNTTLLDTSADTKKEIKSKIGFIRCLYTRHGKGIFPTEDDTLNLVFNDVSQEIGKYSGKIRFGNFDCVLLKYASLVTGIKTIYMSHIDYLRKLDNPKICVAYQYNGIISDEFKDIFQYETTCIGETIIHSILKPHKDLSIYLSQVKPIYHMIHYDEDMGANEKMEIYVKFIENECNISIPIVSFGADIDDKITRKGIEK